MDKLKDEAFRAALMKLKAKFAKDPQAIEDYAEEMESSEMSPEAHEMEEKAEMDMEGKDSDLAPEISGEEEGQEMENYSVGNDTIGMPNQPVKEGQPMTDKQQMMFAEALKAQGSPLAMRASKEAMKMAKMKKKV